MSDSGADESEILLTRVVDAPRPLVWQAWTDPAHFVRWFGPASVAVRNCAIDARPGGTIRFLHEAADGSGLRVDVAGVFEEVAAPERLVILFGFVDPAGQPATHPLVPDWPLHARLRTEATFEERGGKTRLTIRQTVLPAQAAASAGVRKERGLAREGWAETLDRLDALLAGVAARPMAGDDAITFFHSPNTRSSGVRILLEELGAPYELRAINIKAGEQRKPAYLTINPMGKVPAIRHRGALVTEQVAIFIYLADLFPQAKLAPALDDPQRGPYLRWLVYYGSCFEPAVVDRAMKREPGQRAMVPYGDYDSMLDTVTGQLAKGPYLLGERISAADLLWGTALTWTTMFKLVPELPAIKDYIGRINARPAVAKVKQLDAKLSAEHEAAAEEAVAS